MEIDKYFNQNVEQYDSGAMELDYYFLNFIENNMKNKSRLLDIGGGNGNFSNLVFQKFPNINITIVDPAMNLLNKINNPYINKIIGKLPNEINLNNKFDFIHLRNVLHHITGKNIKESKLLIDESLITINRLLDDDGYLLVQDSYNEGYFFPRLPSYLIFHLLAIQNEYGIKIPIKEFSMGLNVYFYTREDLKLKFENLGFEIIESKSLKSDFKNHMKKFLLIKNHGQFSYILKKRL